MNAVAEMVEKSILSYFQVTDGDANNGGISNSGMKALMPTVTIVVLRNDKPFPGCGTGENIMAAISLAVQRATGVALEIIKYKAWSARDREGGVVYHVSMKFIHENSNIIPCRASSCRSPNSAVIRAFLVAANEVKAAMKAGH